MATAVAETAPNPSSMARSLLGGMPCRAVLAFDPDGSYAVTSLCKALTAVLPWD